MESEFAKTIFKQKYALTSDQTWEEKCKDVAAHLTRGIALDAMIARKFIPGGRYLYSAGRPKRFLTNCYCLDVEDTREAWSKLLHDASLCLMSGGGIGVNYSKIREEGAILKGTGGIATGPLALAQMINECARWIVQGGSRRSAVLAVIAAEHPDVYKFMNAKIRTPEQRARKEADYNEPLSFDMTNISIQYGDEFLARLDAGDLEAKKLWIDHCRVAMEVSDPGWFFPGKSGVLSNACSEFRSDANGDSCNLGTVFMPHCTGLDDFREVVWDGVGALMAGRLTGDPASPELGKIGREGNRIGLGLGGIAEWLALRGHGLEMTPELREYLHAWVETSEEAADYWARQLRVNRPKALRAIAPTGTISILAETTGGIEPIFCKAYKRKYLKGDKWLYQYVVDPAVQRLMKAGVALECIQDAYDIGFEARVKFQADVQDFVDMAISSTVNLPEWGSEGNNFSQIEEKADIIQKYAKRLRGLTVYADGSIAGQPLERVPLGDALGKEGIVYDAQENTCKGGTICGL